MLCFTGSPPRYCATYCAAVLLWESGWHRIPGRLHKYSIASNTPGLVRVFSTDVENAACIVAHAPNASHGV